MSPTNRSSGTHFLNLSAYNRFRSRVTSRRRSDSSISDAESIQSSQAEEQGPMVHGCLYCARFYQKTLASPNFAGSTGDCLPTQCTEGEILSSPNLKAFTFNELKNATRNFRLDGIIGEGDSGIVFKGWIDEQTFTASEPGVVMVVAVKKLEPEGFQGHNEWLTDVHYLGQLHHPNLVELIGFCSDGDNRLLVYEFMPRGSLENHLFGRGVHSLSWATRIKVAIGVAKGLAFLHDAKSQVIYGDVKSSNILIDSDFNAKLSDFCLAMAVSNEDMEHMKLFGRMRYRRGLDLLVDELDMRDASRTQVIRASDLGHLSAKADVYGFGVLLLELLSGRRAYDKSKSIIERNLVGWGRRLYLRDKRNLFHIMNSKLEGQFPEKIVHAMANLVSACTGSGPNFRPHMSEVLEVLEKLQTHEEIGNESAENVSKLNVQNFQGPRRNGQ